MTIMTGVCGGHNHIIGRPLREVKHETSPVVASVSRGDDGASSFVV
jgi:hypothetical protein